MYVHMYMYIHTYTQTAVDTLMMKFTTTIHDQAYAVVAEHVKVLTCTYGWKWKCNMYFCVYIYNYEGRQ